MLKEQAPILFSCVTVLTQMSHFEKVRGRVPVRGEENERLETLGVGIKRRRFA